ncbi:hypothetical protein EYC84_000955 [Monilinia fructicola]|uniref:Uncharacterized protein n=1 Tax=Monilinia fructicola TaxID=38448 RepID=A0A5M9JKP1_MONFR|nr:hypothetical protein EYC84_000955 [Monilinia fructicola]
MLLLTFRRIKPLRLWDCVYMIFINSGVAKTGDWKKKPHVQLHECLTVELLNYTQVLIFPLPSNTLYKLASSLQSTQFVAPRAPISSASASFRPFNPRKAHFAPFTNSLSAS